MNLISKVTATTLVALAISPLAMAEDARITCSAVVSDLHNGGLGSGLFAGAQVGDVVTVVIDAEFTRQLPFGDYLYAVNVPTSSFSVGGVVDTLAVGQTQQVSLRNDFIQFGDFFAVSGSFASAPGATFQLLVSDPSGQSWSTNDFRELYGTSLPLGGAMLTFNMFDSTGSVQFDLQSVEIEAAPGGVIGSPYCTAEPNSTGTPGTTSAYGLETVSDNDLSLIASGLPTNVFGYFLASQTQGFTPGAGGSSGNLCLGGAIGRFVGPGQIMGTDFAGEIALAIDMTVLPTPTGPAAVQTGETWNFQLWHRDTSASGTTSNFTSGVALTFQ